MFSTNILVVYQVTVKCDLNGKKSHLIINLQ